MQLKVWIKNARLRTLPLSCSAVLAGVFLGLSQLTTIDSIAYYVILSTLIMITAVFLQVISNYANDYGDSISGADNENRVGPKRGLMRGDFTRSQLKRAIITLVLITMIVGLLTLILAFYDNPFALFSFISLGALSLIGAITYTVGLVYGYKGLGDVSVFIFFGLVAVLGASYIISKTFDINTLIFGMMSGFMAVMVLNVNNLRDHKNDSLTNKNTLIVKFGLSFGKKYHFILLLLSICCGIYLLSPYFLANYLWLMFLIVFIPLLKSAIFCINKNHVDAQLDPMLKKTSISASLINICYGALFLIC